MVGIRSLTFNLLVVSAFWFTPAVAEQVLFDRDEGAIHLRVIERQGPNYPKLGASVPAVHELTLTATRSDVRLDSLSIKGVANIDRPSTGDRLDGYIYLDELPGRTVKTLVWAEDPTKPFQWGCSVSYEIGRKASNGAGAVNPGIAGFVVKETSKTSEPRSDKDKNSNGDCSVTSSPLPPISTGLGTGSQDIKVTFDALFGESKANTGANDFDAALVDAEQKRKARKERESRQDQVAAIRAGLLQEGQLLNEQMLETSKSHRAFDLQQAEEEREAERARRAAKERESGNFWKGVAAVGSAVYLNSKGMNSDDAARFGASMYSDMTGETHGATARMQQEIAEKNYQERQQRLEQLERENQRRLAEINEERRRERNKAYYEDAARSEQMRQQMQAQATQGNRSAYMPPSSNAQVATPSAPTAQSQISVIRQACLDRNGEWNDVTGTCTKSTVVTLADHYNCADMPNKKCDETMSGAGSRGSKEAGIQSAGAGQTVSGSKNPNSRASGTTSLDLPNQRQGTRSGTPGEKYERKEAIAYCWSADFKTERRWRCHGPTQKTMVFDADLEDTVSMAGCEGYRTRTGYARFDTPEAWIYYCDRPRESYDDDVMEIYQLYGAAAVPKIYLCPSKVGPTGCVANK